MKNIHVLPTDKPSRLRIGDNGNFVFGMIQTSIQSRNNDFTNQNIYITSDEKFVRDEYVTDGIEVIKATPKLVNAQGLVSRRNWRKIILTTDPDLIKDGVQAIDDEFLEWFVKNPSCEFVEVGYGWIRLTETNNEGYWISIPDNKLELKIEEPKQETLEEAAEKYVYINYPNYIQPLEKAAAIEDFIAGAKGQAERMYSEEDMIEFAVWLYLEVGSNKGKDRTNKELFNKWFEQFKKK